MAKLQQGMAFNPVIGKCYELHFGEVTIDGQTGFATAKVRIEGAHPSQWIDIEEQIPLNPKFAVYVVKAFEEITCL